MRCLRTSLSILMAHTNDSRSLKGCKVDRILAELWALGNLMDTFAWCMESLNLHSYLDG